MYGKPEMEAPKNRGVPLLSMVEAILILGGLMILVGFFMDWVSYSYVGQTVAIKGSEFGRDVGNYPETFLLPFIGIMFIAGAVFSAGRRRAYSPQKVSKWLFLVAAWIAAIVAMFITVYLTIRYSTFLNDQIGLQIYNNLEFGWFITISGNIILYVGCIFAISPKARALGFTDYYFVRADQADRPTEAKPAPQMAPPMMMPPQPMPPQQYQQPPPKPMPPQQAPPRPQAPPAQQPPRPAAPAAPQVPKPPAAAAPQPPKPAAPASTAPVAKPEEKK